jgi:TonB family protein
VLAPEDDSRALDALRFSLASDIVELVVLTADDTFLQTLREAVGPSRRLWHVLSSDKVSDLLIAGGVGILVLDVQALHEAAARFIAEIKRQFPDLVVVVAGSRDAETELARLISDGSVYRFIHKPMSPARARLFADAAVKRYEEARRRAPTFPTPGAKPRRRELWVGAGCAVGCVLVLSLWLARRATHDSSEPVASAPTAPDSAPAGTASTGSLDPDASLLSRAAQALAANRLTAPPSGDNAFELYLQELGRNPGNRDAKAGIAEVRERLLARAENALLEERLDEAATAIETAHKAGAESGRVTFLATQLAKAREQSKAAAAMARIRAQSAAASDAAVSEGSQDHSPAVVPAADRSAGLAMERIKNDQLIEPEQDSARFYVEQALKEDSSSEAAQQAQQALALKLLDAARGAIDRRDFARAQSWLDAAAGLAAPDNIENLRHSLAAARRLAEGDADSQLLKTAQQRLSEDRLIEPDNDSAKYFVTTLRAVDPSNAGLAEVTQELGARLLAKGRTALTLQQYPAAKSWLDEAASIGYSAPDLASAQRDLDAALARENFLADVANASQLDLVKQVAPTYPKKALESGVEGWVELDFTVSETGVVRDVTVHAASPPGIFDQAATAALLQWHYKPVVRDSKPAAQRARLRIRFALAGH